MTDQRCGNCGWWGSHMSKGAVRACCAPTPYWLASALDDDDLFESPSDATDENDGQCCQAFKERAE